ncbi:MAG: PH domain-containing protein [Jatrophihabitantaceae bacterium]
MSSACASQSGARTFRLPALAYLAVLFLVFGTAPLAFAGDGSDGARSALGPRALLIFIPVLAAVFVARTRTVVDASGVGVRALFGTRHLSWDEVRGLSVHERTVYLVCQDGSLRLPCVRINDLAAVSKASGGRLPEVAEATPKFAPARRRRR